MGTNLNTIAEAIAAIRAGEIIIVVDDANRENEGDFVCAAKHATPENVNFMITHGRGLVCVSLTEKRCAELDLLPMVTKNTDLNHTNFTVSVDLLGQGCTTGISAFDRSKTIRALSDGSSKTEGFARPGHVFPLKSIPGGVLRRAGHTEASSDLARLAECSEVGVLCEILNQDGTMARLDDLAKVANTFHLKMISIKDLIIYRLENESTILREDTVKMPTKWGNFDLTAFTQTDNNEYHMALTKGKKKWTEQDPEEEPVLVRMHSSCITGDIFGSCRCDCGVQLHKSLEMIEKAGKGVLVYMHQEGRGIGFVNKIRAYHLQENGFDTVDANIQLGFRPDERDYGVGAQILRNLGVSKMRLLSNNPVKRAALECYGLEIIESVPIEINSNIHNEDYLKTKRDRMGHLILKK